MRRRRFIATGSAAATLPFLGVGASAQAWPTRPIKIVAGFPAGGQTDLFARTYGDYIAKQLGQSGADREQDWRRRNDRRRRRQAGATRRLYVDVHERDGDDHEPRADEEFAYDSEKDFALISIMPAGSLPMVVSAKTGVKTLAEFVEYARRLRR